MPLPFDEVKAQVLASAVPSSGDDLDGMAIDFDYYLLRQCPSLKAGTITTTSDPDCLVLVSCTALPGARPSVVAEEISKAWRNDLRYRFREAHRLRQTPTTVEMDFVTQTGITGIFVSGQIAVHCSELGTGSVGVTACEAHVD